ncbi:MAG: carbohydrate kinase [Bacteroidetes bacterium]|nr:carbohydrate kinase [Bacteroidota bacterium]
MSLDFVALFSQMSDVRMAVIGDVMLDSYIWGQVERISPEAPVPIVTMGKKENRLGGAGNVALNGAALNSRVFLLSIVGRDEAGDAMLQLLQQNQINTDYILQSEERITTTKTRIISRNQHILRLDHEVTADLSNELEAAFLENIKSFIEKENPQVLIFEDYNKGVLTQNVISQVIAWCKEREILMTVDPKKKNFFAYQGVDIFKPNLKEVREALQLQQNDVHLDSMKTIHRLLHENLSHRISLITLSEKGIFYQDLEESALLPTHVRTIADVSGAGDTVIAVASLVYLLTKDAALMAKLSNLAGGLVCEEVGTVPISKSRLLDECLHLS